MVSMDSFYTIILSLFSTNHITLCLGSRVDIVSKLLAPDRFNWREELDSRYQENLPNNALILTQPHD